MLDIHFLEYLQINEWNAACSVCTVKAKSHANVYKNSHNLKSHGKETIAHRICNKPWYLLQSRSDNSTNMKYRRGFHSHRTCYVSFHPSSTVESSEIHSFSPSHSFPIWLLESKSGFEEVCMKLEEIRAFCSLHLMAGNDRSHCYREQK